MTVEDGQGGRLATSEQAAGGSRTCLPLPFASKPRTGYRIVEVVSRYHDGAAPLASKASRIHLRWRPGEGRFVVVGLERDE